MSSPSPSSPPTSSKGMANTIIRRVSEIFELAADAALGGGWRYPLKGVLYFLTYPQLYRAIAPTLARSLVSSLAILVGMFTFTFLPQAAFCALFSGAFGIAAAVPLVLGESYVLVALVGKLFFVERAQDDIFDAVLLQKGHTALVAQGRQLSRSTRAHNRGVVTKLGKSLKAPLRKFSTEGIVRFLVSLPLNAIPFLGTVLFLLYNGMKAGPGFHARYFQLKGFSRSERDDFVQRHKSAYTAFGAMTLALNLVPVVGLVFEFTSTAGAALWASDLEKKERGDGGVPPSSEEEQVEL